MLTHWCEINASESTYCALSCACDGTPTTDCARTIMLALLFFGTLLLCAGQMIRMFMNTKQLFSYHMGVLFLVLIETALGIVHWGFDPNYKYNYWLIYFKEITLTIITYFFLLSAFVAFEKKNYVKM